MLNDDLRKIGAHECLHCEVGWRHPVGNCVLCGCGPAPGAIDHIPQNEEEKRYALNELLRSLRREPLGREISQMVNEWWAGNDPPSALATAIIKRHGN